MSNVYLYHGTNARQTRLAPSTPVTPLMATLDREQAVYKGLESVLALTHQIKTFTITDTGITLVLEDRSPILTRSMLDKLSVYLYTIRMKVADKWERLIVDNQITDDLQTSKVVQPCDTARIHMSIWLRTKRIIIKHRRF